MRLCKKVFLGAMRQIIFLETRYLRNFALRNCEDNVSIKIKFCRLRRQNTFYTTSQKKILLPKVKSLFWALRAKLAFETDVFFMILLRKIMKNTSVSK
jgi:hypothetical protein